MLYDTTGENTSSNICLINSKKFVVNKTLHAFSSKYIDQAHEKHSAINSERGCRIMVWLKNMSQFTTDGRKHVSSMSNL